MIISNTQKFIVNFFEILESNNIRYCILRNYETLPDSVGHDIDILIENAENQDIINKILKPIILELGWKFVCTHNYNKFITLVCYNISQDSVQVLQLDIWTDLLWRGIPWIDTSSIIDNRRKVNGYFVPAQGAEAAVTAIKELMGKGKVPQKYYDKIQMFSEYDKENFINCFYSIYGEYANSIYQRCVEGDFDSINELGSKLKNKLKKQSLDSYKKYLGYCVSRVFQKIAYFIVPKGQLIAFVGPDGSGKTTIIDKESEYLKPFFYFIKKYHMRFNIFPELKTGHGFSSMKGRVKVSKTDSNSKKFNNKPIKRNLLSILASWFVVIYYTIEFALGRLIIGQIKRKNGLILYDRYYYDFFTQPTTRDLIYPCRRFLLALVKRPDIIIHLNADPEVVYSRKQELCLEEIAAQNIYMKRVLKDVKNSYIVITSTKSANEIAAEVFKIIIDKYEER